MRGTAHPQQADVRPPDRRSEHTQPEMRCPAPEPVAQSASSWSAELSTAERTQVRRGFGWVWMAAVSTRSGAIQEGWSGFRSGETLSTWIRLRVLRTCTAGSLKH
jgi:hypothetical protein